jgi:hypothetical protein
MPKTPNFEPNPALSAAAARENPVKKMPERSSGQKKMPTKVSLFCREKSGFFHFKSK